MLSVPAQGDYASVMTAPSGIKPVVRYRQSATISFRAKATMAIRRMRPLASPARCKNHLIRALPGWWRTHSQAISMASVRARRLPALRA